jgi:hypothetical protein
MKIQTNINSLHTYIVLNIYQSKPHAYAPIILHEGDIQLARRVIDTKFMIHQGNL